MSTFISLFIIGFTAAALPGAVQTTVFLSTLQGKTKEGSNRISALKGGAFAPMS